jgi:hypothetical protein
MNERYFAKVVKVIDEFTIVINAGMDKGVQQGKTFLIVGIGEIIADPDTNEELGSLEIVRGKARVVHVQNRISTLTSADFEKRPDVREIKKVSATGRGNTLATLFGPQDTVTESITPSEPKLKKFTGIEVGDIAIEA